jgi:probable rRNA maturation factor
MAMRSTTPSRPAALRVTVSTSGNAGFRAPGLGAWLTGIAPAMAKGEVSIAIVSDAFIQRLNRDFRGLDVPTDVLSFPFGSDGADQKPGRSRQLRFLGDIVIAAGVARRQAREAGHSVQAEVRTLALHGLLHLLGYDHEHDGGRMARLERRLRRQAGLAAGLIERADA